MEEGQWGPLLVPPVVLVVPAVVPGTSLSLFAGTRVSSFVPLVIVGGGSQFLYTSTCTYMRGDRRERDVWCEASESIGDDGYCRCFRCIVLEWLGGARAFLARSLTLLF